ncbi:MAG: DNA-3-methyladenine glycosylase family protein [Acidimicrobiales bacterium]
MSRHLVAHDPDLAAVVAAHGRPVFWARPPGYASLVLFVLEQQVSLASAAAVYRRLSAVVGVMAPEPILALDGEAMRSAGVSRQKARCLRELSDALVGGRLDLDALASVADADAVGSLTAIPGIGRWTATVYLLACLGRPDLWPTGDRSLQLAVAEALDLPEAPSARDLGPIGERWRPWRSVAARILWHGYLTRRHRVETPNDLLAPP